MNRRGAERVSRRVGELASEPPAPMRRDTRALVTHHYPDPALRSYPGARSPRRRLYLVESLGISLSYEVIRADLRMARAVELTAVDPSLQHMDSTSWVFWLHDSGCQNGYGSRPRLPWLKFGCVICDPVLCAGYCSFPLPL
jgi:hypothetical protein